MVDIVIENGSGGNGNPKDTLLISGSGYTGGESIAANSIVVGGAATTHKLITATSDGIFSKAYISVNTGITTAGYKDISVTGASSGANTYSDYWYVSEGCGRNDIFRLGNFDKLEYNEDQMERAIEEGLDEYESMLDGFVDSTYFPHTLGNYPIKAIKIIAMLASADILMEKGSPELVEIGEKRHEKAMKKIMMIRTGKSKLKLADGTKVAYTPSRTYHNVAVDDFSEVTEFEPTS